MLKEVILGQLSLTMERGTVTKWYKREGEQVQKGELLYTIETDKATQDIEALYPGFLKRILVQEGEEVPVNTIIAYIGDMGDDLKGTDAEEKDKGLGRKPQKPDVQKLDGINAGRKRNPLRNATPLAKKVARELGVELAAIVGTGPEGIIVKKDILNAPVALTVSVGGHEKDPRVDAVKILARKRLSSLRRVTADIVRRSYLSAPHFYLDVTVNMEKVHDSKRRIDFVDFTYTDFLLFTVARALRKYTSINSTLINDEVIIFEEVNIGIVAATDKGLVVPVIKNADALSLTEISATRKRLLEKIKAGEQSGGDISHGTFTITNLGMYGIESFKPVLNLGQSGILAAGKVMNVPTADDFGNIAVKPQMKLTLACDHRVIDGPEAAVFLMYVKELMEFFDG